MPTTLSDWLPIVAAIAAVFSAVIAWGFGTGRFVQRRDDALRDLETRHTTLATRVSTNEGRIADGDRARHTFIDKVNAELGRLRHKYELIQQRMSIDEKHGDERHERIDEQLHRLEMQLNHLQRQIDHLSGPHLEGYDPPDRVRR